MLLGAGTLALQSLEYQRLARVHTGDVYIFGVALAFLVLGVAVGVRLMRPAPPAAADDGNPEAQQALGISARELQVLQELAAGYSNKEIAARLHVSPHTVKTHVARLLDKLDAKRLTEAIHKAPGLGIVP